MAEKEEKKSEEKVEKKGKGKIVFIVVLLILLVAVAVLGVFLFKTKQSEKDIKKQLEVAEKQNKENDKVIKEKDEKIKSLEKEKTDKETKEKEETAKKTAKRSCVGTYKGPCVTGVTYDENRKVYKIADWGTCTLILKKGGSSRKLTYYDNGELGFDEPGAYSISGNKLLLELPNDTPGPGPAPSIKENHFISDDCSEIRFLDQKNSVSHGILIKQ